jgi:hypothetical protein
MRSNPPHPMMTNLDNFSQASTLTLVDQKCLLGCRMLADKPEHTIDFFIISVSKNMCHVK